MKNTPEYGIVQRILAVARSAFDNARERLSRSFYSRDYYCACGKTRELGICPECGTESGAPREDVRGLL